MDILLGYIAGLLTLINPCVLPVLPIVLATALQAHRLGPVALALGMALAFVTLGLGIAAAGRSLGLSAESVAAAGAVLMLGFGLVLLVPRLGSGFALATGGFAARADAGLERVDRDGLGGQFLGGALLGAVWSLCVGPTLGGAIALASQGQSLAWAGAVMAAFAAGVATVILALGYGARAALHRRRALMQTIASGAKSAMGLVFVAVGVIILTGFNHQIEAWLVAIQPVWMQDFSVRY